jgi:hypothetical protein
MPSENVSRIIVRTDEPVRVKTSKRRVSDDEEGVREKTNLFITILRRRATSL